MRYLLVCFWLAAFAAVPADAQDALSPADLPGAVSDSGQTTLATYRVVRRIGMYYKLDLSKDNRHAPQAAAVMRQSEEHFRDCYVERLEDQPHLRGQFALSFEISRRTGGMHHIAWIGGDLKDKQLVHCVMERLGHLTFYPPHDLRGQLLYTFWAEETVASAP